MAHPAYSESTGLNGRDMERDLRHDSRNKAALLHRSG